MMRGLLEADRTNAEYRVEFIQALLRHGKAAEAGPWLDQLDRLQRQAPRNYQLRAVVLSAQGKRAEGVTLLRDFALAHEDQLETIAQFLERMGEPRTAEELYRVRVERPLASNPKAVLSLAEFLGRQGRTT